MVLSVRLRRILSQMVAGNFAWEVPSSNDVVQFNQRANREITVPLAALETLVALGYARRVTHEAAARHLDYWVATERGLALIDGERDRGGGSRSTDPGGASVSR